MKPMPYQPDDPISLTLAADARQCVTDFGNDHIWELSLAGEIPPGIVLHTTFGLRVLYFSLFPIFIEGAESVQETQQFHIPPQFYKILPNFVQLIFHPFYQLEVSCEFWVPDSHSIAGNIQLNNLSAHEREIQLEMAAKLILPGTGQIMKPVSKEGVSILQGVFNHLHPILFFTGGCEFSDDMNAGLRKLFHIQAGSTKEQRWSFCCKQSASESFHQTRKISTMDWEAEKARNEMTNASFIQIQTGDSDWDAAFSMSQKYAFNCLLSPTNHLPYPSFVNYRQIDQAFSPAGDGSDYDFRWNGQTAFDAYFFVDFIVNSSPEIAKGLLLNFLSTQSQDGFIDWKPGLGGNRSQLLCTPLLANLAWKIFQTTEDLDFLQSAAQGLLKFLKVWMESGIDSSPTWSYEIQSGYDCIPNNDHHDQPLTPIHDLISPDLISMLIQELLAMGKMLTLTGLETLEGEINRTKDSLYALLESTWNDLEHSFVYLNKKQKRLLHAGARSTLRDGKNQLSNRHDIRLLLPIWCHTARDDHAHDLIENVILSPDHYWSDFGLTNSPASKDSQYPPDHYRVFIPYNCLIGSGLLSYGYQQEAVDLIRNIMAAVILNLKRRHAFFEAFDPNTGDGLGSPGSYEGLAPMGFFLELCGVRIISPSKIAVRGINPFPNPVKITYRGTTIEVLDDKKNIIFSNGQRITITDPTPCIISALRETT